MEKGVKSGSLEANLKVSHQFLCDCVLASSSCLPLEVGDGDPYGNKDTRVSDVLETMEEPESGHVGIRAFLPKEMVESTAQQKCLYASTHNMSKQEVKHKEN